MLGGDAEAGAVDVDRATLEDPGALANLEAGAPGKAAAYALVAGQFIFAAPPVELEIGRGTPFGIADDNRRGVAQPDVAERLDDHLGGLSRQLPSALGRLLVGGDQHDPLALAAGMHRASEFDHLGSGGFEIVLPKLRMAGEADPDGVMGRPFGGLAIVGHAGAHSGW